MKKIQYFLPVMLFAFILTYLSGCQTDKSKNSNSESTPSTSIEKAKLRHVVIFKFKDTATEEDIRMVERAFADLQSKIPQIRQFEWGINNSPEGLDKGFTHCFILTFDSEAGRDAYLPHPDHTAFAEMVSSFIEDVLVVDYLNE